MARPTGATTKNKKKYAYAVLSGAMTRKDAYLTFINPCCSTPVKSAAELHKTKQMKVLLQETQRSLNETENIKRTTIDITNKQLALAQSLLNDSSNRPYKEQLAILRTLKPIQDNATATLKRPNS